MAMVLVRLLWSLHLPNCFTAFVKAMLNFIISHANTALSSRVYKRFSRQSLYMASVLSLQRLPTTVLTYFSKAASVSIDPSDITDSPRVLISECFLSSLLSFSWNFRLNLSSFKGSALNDSHLLMLHAFDNCGALF